MNRKELGIVEEREVFRKFLSLLEKKEQQNYDFAEFSHADEDDVSNGNGAPDFILDREDGTRLGIELTGFTDETIRSSSNSKWDVIRRAQKFYESMPNTNAMVRVSVIWLPNNTTIAKGDRDTLAKEIALLVKQLEFENESGESKRFYNEDLYLPKALAGYEEYLSVKDQNRINLLGKLKLIGKYVDSLSVFALEEMPFKSWVYPSATYIKTITTTTFSQWLRKKENKVNQQYKGRWNCDEVWLLVFYDIPPIGEPSLARSANFDLNHSIKSNFNRIWIMNDTSLDEVEIDRT